MLHVGLEIHGYINSKEKLFCSCKAIHGAKYSKPNTNICPTCTAQPGAKPMTPNKIAVDKAIQIALILECKINKKLIWQRKHYDWPDLPKGYQNTLSGPHAIPVGEKGKFLGIEITECHLEEDPAAWNPKTGEIDYNRSGSPLIEIVTEPDFTSSEQVIEWLKQLLVILSYIKAIDKNAGIKADVNVSISGGAERFRGSKKNKSSITRAESGVRVEIKNINSLKKIKKAIEHEFQRQKKEKPKEQETRMFDDDKGITKLMRTKEQAQDYRFISDPDLPIIQIKNSEVKKLKSQLPETPNTKLDKLIKKYKIPERNAKILTKKLEIVEFFEKIIEKTNPDLAVRWVTEELLSVLNYNKKELDEIDLKPEHFIELLKLIEQNKITELKAKEILRGWKEKSSSPKSKSHEQISDSGEIEKIVKTVIKEHPKAVADFKKGEQKSLNFLIGQVMRLTEKRADYKTTRGILERILN